MRDREIIDELHERVAFLDAHVEVLGKILGGLGHKIESMDTRLKFIEEQVEKKL